MEIKISASLLKDYLVCKQKACYRINEPYEAIQTREMALGSAVHHIIETRWQEKDSAIAHIPVALASYGIEDNVTVNQAENLVNGFFDLFPPTYFSEEDSIEKYFKIPYKKDVFLTGKMDRITSTGLVFDWKTSKSPPEDVDRDPQFILYYLAYKHLYNKEPRGVAYVSLLHRKIYYFTPVKGVLQDFEDNIIPDCIQTLKQGTFSRDGLYGYKTCSQCSFKSLCWSEVEDLNDRELVRRAPIKK